MRGVTLSNSADLMRLLNLLETRYAMRLLWALRDGRPQSFRQLQLSVGGAAANTINARVIALRSVDLLMRDRRGYCVTAQGLKLLEHIQGAEVYCRRFTGPKQNVLGNKEKKVLATK